MARRWTAEEIKLRNQIRLGKIARKYTVKGGDSWFKIAGRLYAKYFGGDVKAAQRMAGELARANRGVKRLKAGITLKLPLPPMGGRTPYIAPGQFADMPTAPAPAPAATARAPAPTAPTPTVADIPAPPVPPGTAPPPSPGGRPPPGGRPGGRRRGAPTVPPVPAGFGGIGDPRR